MRGTQEGTQRLVTTEQRIHVVEARRVVPMRAPSREDWCEVQNVGAEIPNVVQVPLYPRKISAVKLERGVRPATLRQPLPFARNGPNGPFHIEAARGEPVGKDLVNNRTAMPRRCIRSDSEHVVIRSGDVVSVRSDAIQPAVAELPAIDQPAIASGRIRHGEIRPPPRVDSIVLIDDRLDDRRLSVLNAPEPHARG